MVYNIEDVDLNSKDMLEVCMRNWYTIEELSETHIKALDLLIDMKDRWRNSGLTADQKRVVQSLIIDNDSELEVVEDLDISLTEINILSQEGLELLSGGGR